MLVDDRLNLGNIRGSNGPFSDSDGQHDHFISDLNRGRQKKMKELEKNFRPHWSPKTVKRWVDFDLGGLKIARLYWPDSY